MMSDFSPNTKGFEKGQKVESIYYVERQFNKFENSKI